MTDGYALLRAIEANPDEDTPRLAYADWLDERATTDLDRARAELIRVQCALEREPPGNRKGDLAAREYKLLHKYRAGWESAYPFLRREGTAYIRGFIFPDVTGTDLVKHGEALAAVVPVNVVRLRHATRALTDVAACPTLRHVRNLYLESNGLRNHHLPTLLGSPHLVNVRVLTLSYNHLGIASCEALAASPAFPALRVLALHGNPIRDRGLEALTGASWFANLFGLHVSNCEVSAAGAIRFAGLSAVSQLRSLNVSGGDRTDATARAILDSPHLSNLAQLWHPERDLSAPVRAALRARFGANLNPMRYFLDRIDGGRA